MDDHQVHVGTQTQLAPAIASDGHDRQGVIPACPDFIGKPGSKKKGPNKLIHQISIFSGYAQTGAMIQVLIYQDSLGLKKI